MTPNFWMVVHILLMAVKHINNVRVMRFDEIEKWTIFGPLQELSFGK